MRDHVRIQSDYADRASQQRAHIVLDGNTDDSDLQQFTETSNMTIWANTEVQFTLIPLVCCLEIKMGIPYLTDLITGQQ